MGASRTLVYTSQFCGYCHAAIRLLTERGIEHDVIDVTHDPDSRVRMVALAGGRKTVPQIFIDGRAIGGYMELSGLDRSGELREMLGGGAGDESA